MKNVNVLNKINILNQSPRTLVSSISTMTLLGGLRINVNVNKEVILLNKRYFSIDIKDEKFNPFEFILKNYDRIFEVRVRMDLEYFFNIINNKNVKFEHNSEFLFNLFNNNSEFIDQLKKLLFVENLGVVSERQVFEEIVNIILFKGNFHHYVDFYSKNPFMMLYSYIVPNFLDGKLIIEKRYAILTKLKEEKKIISKEDVALLTKIMIYDNDILNFQYTMLKTEFNDKFIKGLQIYVSSHQKEAISSLVENFKSGIYIIGFSTAMSLKA